MTIAMIAIGAVAMVIISAILVFFVLHLRDVFFVTGAPYIPLDRRALECLLDNMPSLQGKTFYELGCGNGRVLSAVHAQSPTTHCVGIERGWRPYILARLRLRQLIKTGAIELIYNDIRRVDLSNADVVFTYLMDDFLAIILPKLENELKGGAIVISAQFRLGNKKSYKIIKVPGGSAIANKLYYYKF